MRCPKCNKNIGLIQKYCPNCGALVPQLPLGERKKRAIIFVIWLSVVYPSFSRDQIQEEVASSTSPSPLSAFSDTLLTGFSAIGEQFGKIKETVSSFTTAPAYYSATSTDSIGTTTGQ